MMKILGSAGARAPVIRLDFSADIPPAFVPQLRDYGAAGARKDNNWI